MGMRTAWTVEQKRDMIAEYEAAPHGTKSGVLRRHGITGRELRNWRSAQDAGVLEVGLTPRTVRRTPAAESAEILRLRHEVVRLEAQVARAHKEIDDRQHALEALGKATALLHDLVSPRSADASETTRPRPSSH